MKERRIQRLQELIKERVAEVIDQELADPRRGLITVTRVKLDREVTQCTVYWSIFGTEAQRRTNERMLQRAAGFVQRQVGAVLHTRTVPRLRFAFDESIEGAQRLDAIIEELRQERHGPLDESDGALEDEADSAAETGVEPGVESDDEPRDERLGAPESRPDAPPDHFA